MRFVHIPLLFILATAAGSFTVYSQQKPSPRAPSALPSAKTYKFSGGRYSGFGIENGDTVIRAIVNPIYVFERPKDMRKYQRLVRNVKKVYPIAKEAQEYMRGLEEGLAGLKTKREREAYTKKVEKEILKKYTPVLEKMTFSEGKILIKLIDRETEHTSYELLREFRGGFTAGFWNTVARMFKANLKDGYDADGEDKLIEQIIILYEAGLL